MSNEAKLRPRDLRIGSLVNHWSGIREIGGVLIDSVEFMPKEDLATGSILDEIEGIEVTEEWLKRMDGFYQLPHFTVTNSWFKNLSRNRKIGISCVGTPNLMVFLEEYEVLDGVGVLVKDVIPLHNWDFDGEMYVHQLQNLIAVLTGEELSIAEKMK